MTTPHAIKCRTSRHCPQGIGLIEAVFVISIMSVAFSALLGAMAFFLRDGLFAAEKIQALYLLDEGVEAVRFLRDQGYAANITPLIGVGTRYLDPAAGGWTVTTVNTPIFGRYTRTVSLDTVYRRNADDDIVPSSSADPKTADPGTARLTVTVTWGAWSESTITYVADIYEN